jgi:ribosomal protein L11 methyltransferase
MSEPRYPYVHIDVPEEAAEDAGTLLWELGAEGVEERDAGTLAKGAGAGRVTLVAAFPTHEAAAEAVAELPAEWHARVEEVVGDAWRDAWKEHYRPFALTPGVVVRPPWEEYAAKPGEQVLVLEPGRAFGTGLHATTTLVARALDAEKHRLVGHHVMDVGTAAASSGSPRSCSAPSTPSSRTSIQTRSKSLARTQSGTSSWRAFRSTQPPI